jgi:hypothetical protein
VISFFRKIIGQKMKDRVVSTTGNDASEFDKKCLPKEFGGEVGGENIQNFSRDIFSKSKEMESKFAYLSKFESIAHNVVQEPFRENETLTDF